MHIVKPRRKVCCWGFTRALGGRAVGPALCSGPSTKTLCISKPLLLHLSSGVSHTNQHHRWALKHMEKH